MEGVYVTEGGQINESFVIHLASTFVDPISGAVLSVMSFEPTAINGFPTGFCKLNLAVDDPNDQQCISLSGVTYGPGSHQLEVVGELTILPFGALPWERSGPTPHRSPQQEGTFGCTYSYAANQPTCHHGRRQLRHRGMHGSGGMQLLVFATVDVCTYGQQAAEGCQFDSNDDGSIGSSDLLDFLTAFGFECE